MKKLLSLLSLTFLLFSCQKDLIKPDTTPPETLSGTNKDTVIYRENSDSSYFLTGTIFNPCTQENMLVTGTLFYHLHEVIKAGEDTIIHYTYESHYENLIGVGETSGKKYKGASRYIYHFNGKAIFIHDSFLGDHYEAIPLNEVIINKLLFKFPGSDNNFLTKLTYRLHTFKDGTYIEKSTFLIDQCR